MPVELLRDQQRRAAARLSKHHKVAAELQHCRYNSLNINMVTPRICAPLNTTTHLLYGDCIK